MTQMYAPSYSKWEKHFLGMAQGKLATKGKIFILKKDEQTGSGNGIQLVTPVAQVDAMAKALLTKKKRNIKQKLITKKKKNIKQKPATKKNHSVKKPRTVKTYNNNQAY